MQRSVFIGYDAREIDAYKVATASLRSKMRWRIPVGGVVLDWCMNMGFYRRKHERRGGQMYDVISDAPMSTEFAISRFLVPHLAGRSGWALFVDCDVMFRRDPDDLFDLCDDRYAVMCVKHTQMPTDPEMVAAFDASRPVEGGLKMDGQRQTYYARKNWSSVMLFNLGHPANRRLTLDLVNTAPGRDLHRFCWLMDEQIGALPREWNHLVGVDPPNPDAAIVHFTLGVPSMPGYENSEHADEWRSCLAGVREVEYRQ